MTNNIKTWQSKLNYLAFGLLNFSNFPQIPWFSRKRLSRKSGDTPTGINGKPENLGKVNRILQPKLQGNLKWHSSLVFSSRWGCVVTDNKRIHHKITSFWIQQLCNNDSNTVTNTKGKQLSFTEKILQGAKWGKGLGLSWWQRHKLYQL